MNQWFVSLLSGYATWHTDQFIRKTLNPIAAQEQFLTGMLRHYRSTARGKTYRVGEIRSIDEFRDRLPMTQYSDYEADIQRIAAGEQNLLTPEPVRFITITSGTTGARKWIPITRRFHSALQRANFASFGFVLKELKDRGLTLEPSLIANSVQLPGKTSAGIEYGLASTGNLRMSKLVAAPLFANPYDILQIRDSRTRQYLCLLFGLRCRHLQSMAANFPMLLLRTCRYLEEEAESLIQCLKTGRLPDDLNLPPEWRRSLQSKWSSDPTRAAELETILRQQGSLTPKLAWPNLEFVSTARGGTSDFYFQSFDQYFGQAAIFGGVYGCSEATFGIAHAFNEDGCILALESGFYEFVPESEWESDHPETLLPSETRIGDRYRILVTNDSGFYRYDIRDVVEVVGFYEKTPLIVFRYRLGGLLNSTSEKTTEFHVIATIRRLQQEFNVGLEDFCITLSEHDIPAHYWVNIELDLHSTLENPEMFLQRFDAILQQENGHYQVMRRDQVPPPGLRILAHGSFERFRQELLNRGTGENQLKVPHISENRTLLTHLSLEAEVCWPSPVSRFTD